MLYPSSPARPHDQTPRQAAGRHRAALLQAARAHARRASCAVWLAVVSVCAGASPAFAQDVLRYENAATSDRDGVNETATPCDKPLVRQFAVDARFVIADVDIGVLLQHSYRADLRMTLQSPQGTRVMFNRGVGGGADNYNVLTDDEARAALSAHTTDDSVTDGTSAPPYQRTFRPSAPLEAFDGEDARGVWQLEICDAGKGDSGTFYRADLYLAQAPENYADLSLTKTVSNAAPAPGETISYTLTVANAEASPAAAADVAIRDVLPAGVRFVSASGAGSYDSETGLWLVGTLKPGEAVSITLTVQVVADQGSTVANRAEITGSDVADLDSVPNNGSASEDDDDAANFTVSGRRVAGTVPTLRCPAGLTIFDWDTVRWTAGSTANSYPVTELGTVDWAISLDGQWLSNATYGGQSPALQTAVTGGLPAGQRSLFLYPDFATIAQVSLITLTLPTPVPALQFTIFDVDYNAGQFADRITVTGTYNGAPVTPTLTNGVANYVIGNSAYGDVVSADTSANGNVAVTFDQPVDSVTINYGNHDLAPVDPGGQAIAVHDISICHPQAMINIDKSSELVSDPVHGTSAERNAIPGAIIRYCLLVTNNGSGHATSVTVTDAIPATLTYVAGSMQSGATCTTASTPEDDDAAGADEADPHGASFAGSTISAAVSQLVNGQTMAIRFSAAVN